MTFDEFKEFYETKGYLPNDVGRRKNKLNDRQLETRHRKYLQQKKKEIEKSEYTIDKEWEELKDQLDFSQCSLMKRLYQEGMLDELAELRQNASWLIQTIDPAHVFPKGGYPFLKYDVENVVPLNRYSHSCLDTMRDPISGKSITKEDHTLFWMFITGIETYTNLERKVKEHGKARYGIEEVAEEV